MYLSIGNDMAVRSRSIIGIFDMDNATLSAVSRRFLSGKQKQNLVESAIEDIPKSFILYKDGEEYKICFSQLSTSALKGRMKENL